MTEAPVPPDNGSQGIVSYADWAQRVLGCLIDAAILVGGALVVVLLGSIVALFSDQLGEVVRLGGYLAIIVAALRNQVIVQGNTGQSIGKKQMGLKLISARTGAPLGPGRTFVRQTAHLLDFLSLIGCLWPLWDDKKQTFSDKIMTSIVVRTGDDPTT
jgi:uncharacterized RDD family membrane protein YckC